MSEQVSNETISNSSTTNKISEIVDYVLSKSLLLFGLIAVICIIIIGIIIMIYCILKKRKQKETRSDPGFGLRDKGAPGSRHFEFKKLQNTSSFGGDVSSNNKENMSLSEIRIKNLKMEIKIQMLFQMNQLVKEERKRRKERKTMWKQLMMEKRKM